MEFEGFTFEGFTKKYENGDKLKMRKEEYLYFIWNIYGEWKFKITKHGNVKFCEVNRNGNIFHPNVFYTLYYDYTNGFYFRRTCPSGQYQLFRKTKYDYANNIIIDEWKHFTTIETAVAYFNQYYDKMFNGKHQYTHYSFLGEDDFGRLLTGWKHKF